MAFDIPKFLNEMDHMTVSELVDVVKAIEDRFNVSAQQVAGPGIETVATPKVEEKSVFDVFLTNAGANKVNVIKAVREITGLGLVEAKRVVDTAPIAVKEGIDKADADALKAKLETIGATVELR